MGRYLEKVLTSERFQKTASVLPILMGLIPKQNSQYFKTRENIIAKIKEAAVDLYPRNHRRADIKMAKAQKELEKLEFDKKCNLLIPFAQAPLRKTQENEGTPEKPRKRAEIISAEDAAFRADMKKAELEILATIEKKS